MTNVTLIRGDARRLPLADKSVQMVCTSPPYFGLRDYQTARWDGGDGACEHVAREIVSGMNGTTQNSCRPGRTPPENIKYRDICGKCGARRVDAQIGLEPSIDAYVATMVQVFREVRRVLRDDGCIFVNMGDSYAQSQMGRNRNGCGNIPEPCREHVANPGRGACDLGSKQLLGIPWRVAFALQADGWILRSDIIWAKPNPMPEPVTDRPTKSHEYIFLLAKRPNYYYDAEAVRESALMSSWATNKRLSGKREDQGPKYDDDYMGDARARVKKWSDPTGRNLRSVWSITPRPFAGAHFATFPSALVQRCVAAGTSERGQCPHCGTAWRRVVSDATGGAIGKDWSRHEHEADMEQGSAKLNGWKCRTYKPGSTLGWQPGCTCSSHEPVPQVVLDPFGGAGTVPLVASNMGRRGVMVELSAKYVAMARRRISRPHARHERPERAEDLPLFAGLD